MIFKPVSTVIATALVLGCGPKNSAETGIDAGASSSPPTVLRDLTYTPPPGVDAGMATLDLFRPAGDHTSPLVLLVHGGSWVGGDKSNFESTLVPWWNAQGYAAAPVNFRLSTRPGESPQVKPRDQARDVAAALGWMMASADEYKIETEDIVLVGYSSGAHLVALLGTDERILQEAGLDETQVAAAISLDVHAYDVPYALELMEGSVVEDNIPSIQHLFGSTTEEQLEGSPIHYVDGWAASALVVSTDEDPEVEGTYGFVVAEAASHYADALAAADHSVTTLHDRTETHSSLVMGFGEPEDLTTAAIEALLASLRR